MTDPTTIAEEGTYPMRLNPDKLTHTQLQAVDQWLIANGCTHYVALEPITIKGRRAHYTALCRRDKKSVERIPVREGCAIPLGQRSVHIRVPLSNYLTSS